MTLQQLERITRSADLMGMDRMTIFTHPSMFLCTCTDKNITPGLAYGYVYVFSHLKVPFKYVTGQCMVSMLNCNMDSVCEFLVKCFGSTGFESKTVMDTGARKYFPLLSLQTCNEAESCSSLIVVSQTSRIFI